MASLTQAISEVSAAASRAALTSGLDDLSAQLAREHVKREQLVREAADERAYAIGASEMRQWARLVSERATCSLVSSSVIPCARWARS